MSSSRLTVALAGNPNSGKTTVFNAITGARQHVGNYPGVTVEKKEGSARHSGADLHVVDLPGTYSLTAYSIEEIVARNFLIEEGPDVVVDIIDSSNLERNLYLATQFLELGVPLVLAFNMSDVAESRGFSIDRGKLSELLGVPIVPTVGHKGRGVDDLLDVVLEVGADPAAAVARQRRVRYGHEIEPHVEQLTELIDRACSGETHRARWFALKLLENDSETIKRLAGLCGEEKLEPVLAEALRLRRHIESICGDPPETVLADRRYGFISGACTEAVRRSVEARHELSDKIDAVMTNRWLGLPIFAALMYLVFQLTFTVGNPCVDFLGGLMGDLGVWVSHMWPRGSESLLRSLIVDGVIGGVGAVIVFVPLILLLFLAIAFLEDTGYMARAAFIMDRLMHKIGLHGKSFVPMLIGFGCSVPAIMATRTLESRRDRLTTMLVVPLMSCGARLPIYMLIIPAFFPTKWHTPMLWIIYVIGIVLAILCAKLLRATLFRGESTPFVMELPPYRMPTIKGLMIHMWERNWMYLRKAGTIIFALAVILWAANTFPQKKEFDKNYGIAVAQTEKVYEQDTQKLSAALGLPGESDLLVRTVRAELVMIEQQEEYWEHQEGYTRAIEAKDAAIKKLTRGDTTGLLAAFVEIRDNVVEARETFDEAVEKEQVGGVLELDEARDEAVADARNAFDEAVRKAGLQEGSTEYRQLKKTRDQTIAKADDEFAEAIEDDGLEKDLQEYLKLRKTRDDTVAEVRESNPRVFAVVKTYLDEVKATYDEAVGTLANEQKAEEMEYSVSGRVGQAMVPVLSPMGFENWRLGTALIGAFGAKEVFVSQMGIVYSLGAEADEESEPLREKLREDYTPLQAFCIILFCLVSAPCLATIAVTKRESGSFKWAMFQLLGLTALAYALTTAVYQVGRLFL